MCNPFLSSQEMCLANYQNRALVLAPLRLYHKLYAEPMLAPVVGSTAMARSHLVLSMYKFDRLYCTPDYPNHLSYFVVSNSNGSNLQISLNRNDSHLFQRPKTVVGFLFRLRFNLKEIKAKMLIFQMVRI